MAHDYRSIDIKTDVLITAGWIDYGGGGLFETVLVTTGRTTVE